jgi:hypothetical protein
MKVGGVFFYVRLDGQEILIDEGRGLPVSIGLGLQPSARASSRGGAEIDQEGSLCGLSFCQSRVSISVPLYSHILILL